MKNALVFVALFLSLRLFAGVEDPLVQSLAGTVFVPYPSNGAINPALPVNQVNTPTTIVIGPSNWGNSFTLKSVTNLVKLYSDQNSATAINFDYELSVPVIITYYKNGVPGPVTLPAEILRITYHPDPSVQREYQQTDAFRFAEGCRVEVRVQTANIKGKRLGGAPLTPQEMEKLAKTVFLQSEIVVERYYQFDPAYLICPNDITLTAQASDNSLEVKWRTTMPNQTTTLGAEEYDLEWIYVDDYAMDIYGNITYRLPTVLLYDFSQNAARVQIKGNSYRIPMVYEHGYLLVRVRGIGRNPADNFASPLVGKWSCGFGSCQSNICNGNSNKVADYLNRFTIGTAHENDKKNWQAVTTYAEQGKRKDVVSYYDGTMRNRQSVTGLNSDRQTLVGETIYDHQGRAAIQVLPAPVNNATLKYYANFNQNAAGQPYNRLNFDLNDASCKNNAAAMRPNNSGAANYYSSLNPDKSGFNAFIPDAKGYPFSHTEYTPDNTGRIARQGGVGPTHQLNKTHEAKYFYGVPHQEELDQLFGSEAGHALHYKKNMAMDPNGQASLTYQDAKGNTIATALAGNSPTSLQKLSSHQAVPFTVNLLAHNQKDMDDYALVMEETELVTTESNYVFDYACLATQLNYTDCDGTKYCLDCIYDLAFKITDNLKCGEVVFEKKQTVGKLFEKKFEISLGCDILQIEQWSIQTPFTVNLLPGSYTFSKRLVVNEAAADAYVKAVLDTCPQLYNQILQQQYAQMDTSGCEVDCADAKADKSNASYYDKLSPEGKDSLNELISDLCESLPVSSCEAAYAAMLSDLSPGGQYGHTLSETQDPYELATSVFYSGNILGANPLSISYPNGGGVFSTIEQLLDNWQPEWAEQLLQFHPEKCYYDFCTAHLAPSDLYNAQMMNTETYQDANAAGYLSNNLLLNDPFFYPANGPTPIALNALLNGYTGLMGGAISTNYRNSGLPMHKLALKVAAYPNNAPNDWGSASATVQDLAWPIYRALYLSYKEELCYKIRTQYAIKNNCYNECMGNPEFNPFLNGFWNGVTNVNDLTNNFWVNTSQKNCDLEAYHFFKNKTKRFPSIYDLLPNNFPLDFYSNDQTEAFNYLYNQTEQIKEGICCDSLFTELPNFLFAVYQNNQPSFILNLGNTNNYPDAVEGALLHGALQATGTFTKDNTGVYSVVVSVPSGSTMSPTYTPCSNLKFKFLQAPTGTIKSFCCYEEIANPTLFTGPGIHFIMYGLNTLGAKFKIEGIYSPDCPFECPAKPLPCTNSLKQEELLVLFNYLIYNDKFRAGQVTLPINMLGPELRTVFSGHSGNFIWEAAVGSSTSFTATLKRGKKTCTFNLTQPAGHNWLQTERAWMLQPEMSLMDAMGKVTAFKLRLQMFNAGIATVTGSSPCFILSDCCLPSEEECKSCPPLWTGQDDQPMPKTVLALVTPTDCDPPCEPKEEFSRPLANPCAQQMIDIAQHNAQEIYEDLMLQMKADMKAAYMKKCMQAVERFNVTYTDARHHFTLYYYDQGNNLVETVPPSGVVPLTTAQITQVAKGRAGQAVQPVYGAHTLVSRYSYNSLNQLIWQKIPDHTGPAKFWYDRLGRLKASQNAKQAATQQYSYTKYDGLGRIREVGQVKKTTPPTSLYTDDQWTAWLNTNDRDQITKTWYDRPGLASAPALFPTGTQDNLRGRVANVSFEQVPNFLTISWVHYSYDIHGNVKTMVQDNFIIGPKAVEYEYDLVSGNVNALVYQRNKPDQFLHRYAYDADNRLTTARTSPDGVLWDTEVKYKYYKHGPLARTELGDDRVQGLDYAYTLHGWLKGMNSGSLQPDRDMGKDGQNATPGNFARDATGFLLGYYEGEYEPIGNGGGFEPSYSGSNLNSAALAPSLYNGNIRNMVTAIKPFMAGQKPMATMYRYDQLNRLTMSRADFTNFDPVGNKWLAGAPNDQYSNQYTYDPNGNIQNLKRNGNKTGAQLKMDQQQFLYYLGTNQLSYVTDSLALSANYTEDIDGQKQSTYIYDPIGNLIEDKAEKLKYVWNLQGKVTQIDDADAPAKTIRFGYDAMGNRYTKEIANQKSTFYTYDASGNVLATYQMSASGLFWESTMLYGAKRLGGYRADKCLGPICTPPVLPANHFYRWRGKRLYEESNHLGNVLATSSDRKQPKANASGLVTFFEPDVVTAQDYYPFGMGMPGRTLAGDKARYGFNGKENDNEVKGTGNYQDYGMRVYDGRLGRFFAVDPLFSKYPWYSPYQFSGNSPIKFVDLDGLEEGIHNIHQTVPIQSRQDFNQIFEELKQAMPQYELPTLERPSRPSFDQLQDIPKSNEEPSPLNYMDNNGEFAPDKYDQMIKDVEQWEHNNGILEDYNRVGKEYFEKLEDFNNSQKMIENERRIKENPGLEKLMPLKKGIYKPFEGGDFEKFLDGLEKMFQNEETPVVAPGPVVASNAAIGKTESQ